MDPVTALLAFGGAALNFFGPDPQRRLQSSQTNAINLADILIQQQFGLGASVFDPARDIALEEGLQRLAPEQQDILGQILGLNQGLQNFGESTVPELFGQAQQFIDPRVLGPGATEVFDATQQDIQNRGNTAQLSFIEDRARDLFDSAAQGIGPVASAASDIIQAGGRTPESIELQQALQQIIDAGGQTSETEELFRAGTGLIGSGGFTPELRDLQSLFQSQLRAGGLTPEARRFLAPLQDIIDAGGAGGGVLSDQQATSLARDAAITAAAGQAEAAQRRAFQRGSAPGTLVGSGLANQGLGEFEDASLRAEAEAVRQALFNQQNARLQQLGIATGGASSVLSDASRILASANAGLGSIAGAASRNLATGAGLASDSQRIAAQRLGLGIQGANQNFANDIARLGTGGSIFSNAMSDFQGLAGLSLGTQLGVEQARRQQQNAAAQQLLGLTGFGVDTRGQNIGAADDQTRTMLQAILGQGPNLQVGSGLVTDARDQRLNIARMLFGQSATNFGNIPSLFGSRTAAITGIQPTGDTPLQALGNAITQGNLGAVFGEIFGGDKSD